MRMEGRAHRSHQTGLTPSNPHLPWAGGARSLRRGAQRAHVAMVVEQARHGGPLAPPPEGPGSTAPAGGPSGANSPAASAASARSSPIPIAPPRTDPAKVVITNCNPDWTVWASGWPPMKIRTGVRKAAYSAGRCTPNMPASGTPCTSGPGPAARSAALLPAPSRSRQRGPGAAPAPASHRRTAAAPASGSSGTRTPSSGGVRREVHSRADGDRHHRRVPPRRPLRHARQIAPGAPVHHRDTPRPRTGRRAAPRAGFHPAATMMESRPLLRGGRASAQRRKPRRRVLLAARWAPWAGTFAEDVTAVLDDAASVDALVRRRRLRRVRGHRGGASPSHLGAGTGPGRRSCQPAGLGGPWDGVRARTGVDTSGGGSEPC